MKTVLSIGSIAVVLALAACGGGAPATKPVQKNEERPAAGSMKSPTEALKEKMSSSSDAAADAKKN